MAILQPVEKQSGSAWQGTWINILSQLGGHHSISRGGVGGGGWSFFEINNLVRTLREINNLL